MAPADLKLTPAQLRVLVGLTPAGGTFDRWVRIVAGGEVLSAAGSTVALTLFRRGLIEMIAERVEVSALGVAALDLVDGSA